ncbi:MAG TPA: thiamine pyrophosphate-requiring protein [Gaiellales bacterium]|nr:thiamine pyrophosphate-requiring protein [Gaiellales bacterium]
MPELVADRICQLLQREGAEVIVGFPENRLLNSAALIGMRPIITRTERVAVNIADGFARATNGERFVPCAAQYGPGAEASFAAVAQAYGDRSPILLLPSEHDVALQGSGRELRSERAYAPITRFAATVNDAARGPEIFRRALNALRGPRNGPVLVTIANDVLNGEAGYADWNVTTTLPRLTQAAAEDVAATAKALLGAARPVILAGQGVLYAGATPELLRLAELTGTPVATTLNGKSAFPENHPLALGTAGRTRPATVDRFFAEADLVLGIGTSFTRSLYITPLPAGATLGQITDDRSDLATGYDVAFGAVGDARLVLLQLLEEIGSAPSERRAATEGRVESVRAQFMQEWGPRLASDAAPLSPYRVVWELMQVVDRERTVVTHDAGHPRDQIVPFYETLVPRGYLGWGKSTQLGTGLGLAMGARLARPDWLAVNIMGDAAFGMVGMDFETAVRSRLPILTIVLNNGLMGGYTQWMPDAVSRYGSDRLGGSYADVARALGGHAERVVQPGELRSALERCIASVAAGQAALCEVATHEEPAMAGHT